MERSHLTRRIVVLVTRFSFKRQRRTTRSILIAEIPASIAKARKSLYRQFKAVHQSVSGPSMDASREYPTPMVQSGLPDCAMECHFTFETCTTTWPMAKTAYDKRLCVKFDGPLISFGATVSYKPISSKDEGVFFF